VTKLSLNELQETKKREGTDSTNSNMLFHTDIAAEAVAV